MNSFDKRKIILASSSPRRKSLLKEAGYDFDIIPPSIEEPSTTTKSAKAAIYWAEALAYLKGSSVAQHHPEDVIISADTIVTYGNNLIGKAKDAKHAREILSNMFEGESKVITGLAILCPALDKRIIKHEITTITMRAMTPEELDKYIESGKWIGKAGAYAYQEGGDKFALKVKGCISNIIGLPIELLGEILAE